MLVENASLSRYLLSREGQEATSFSPHFSYKTISVAPNAPTLMNLINLILAFWK